MNGPILYCDFDGVIYDTIDVAFRKMKEQNVNKNDKRARNSFFINLNYQELYDESTIINDAVNKLLLLKRSNIFSDIIILTKLSGNYEEERIKRRFLEEKLPGIRVVTLQFDLRKSVIVNPVGNILIDDEPNNCKEWKDALGVAVLFDKGVIDLENDIINDMLDLTNTDGVKRLIKKL